jgi:arylsulfatase A-like enzyme
MADRPNILLFFTDQHRLSALGCYGPTPCRTPNIDRLAREGVRFETVYTPCPVCSPTRASIMTGQHVHRHGVLCNVNDLPTPVKELPDGPHLLSRRLAAAGYQCGHTGKWHLSTRPEDWLGLELDSAHPTRRGFEWPTFPGYEEYLKREGLDPNRKRTHRHFPCARLDAPPEASRPYWQAEQTMRMIDEFAEDDGPFFIWHCEPGPHAAYDAPADFLRMYEDVEIPPWPNYEWDAAGINGPHRVKLHPAQPELTWEDWAHVLRHYYALTTDIDSQLGRILDHLEERGLLERTVVIFTSDHGQTLGSHGGLNDKGWHHFEEIQRVGLIVRNASGWGRNGARAGHVASQWGSVLDLYPTTLDIAGADWDAERVDGRSLVPLLRAPQKEFRDTVFVEFWGVNGVATTMMSCRHGNMKYGWNCGNRDELYDLAADPHETQNLIGDPAYADRRDDLRARIAGFMESTGHPGFGQASARRLWDA